MTMQGRLTYQTSILLLLAMGLLLVVALYTSIIRPLGELQKGINKVKEGELDFTLEVETDDEIGELTSDFEEMRMRERRCRMRRIR